MKVHWQVVSVQPRSISELRTEINEMSHWMPTLPVQYLPGAVSHSLSSVFGIWLQSVLSYSKVRLTVVAMVRTGHRSACRNHGPWKHDVAKSWHLILHKKICKLLGEQAQLYSRSCVYKSFYPKWPNVPQILFKRFFRYSAFTSGLLSHNTVASSPSYFNLKCPCLQLSGTAFSLSSIKRCI